jgi:hypothetical protein
VASSSNSNSNLQPVEVCSVANRTLPLVDSLVVELSSKPNQVQVSSELSLQIVLEVDSLVEAELLRQLHRQVDSLVELQQPHRPEVDSSEVAQVLKLNQLGLACLEGQALPHRQEVADFSVEEVLQLSL